MLRLSSSALQPLCQQPFIEDKKAHEDIISAPFDVLMVKLEAGELKICVKAKDHQKSFYYFFDLQTKDQVANLHMRRSISKIRGYRREQEFQMHVADIPIFNKPLTLRLVRKTVRGEIIIREDELKP